MLKLYFTAMNINIKNYYNRIIKSCFYNIKAFINKSHNINTKKAIIKL